MTYWERGRCMKKEYESLNLHQKMEILIKEMVEKELPLHDSLREFNKKIQRKQDSNSQSPGSSP